MENNNNSEVVELSQNYGLFMLKARLLWGENSPNLIFDVSGNFYNAFQEMLKYEEFSRQLEVDFFQGIRDNYPDYFSRLYEYLIEGLTQLESFSIEQFDDKEFLVLREAMQRAASLFVRNQLTIISQTIQTACNSKIADEIEKSYQSGKVSISPQLVSVSEKTNAVNDVFKKNILNAHFKGVDLYVHPEFTVMLRPVVISLQLQNIDLTFIDIAECFKKDLARLFRFANLANAKVWRFYGLDLEDTILTNMHMNHSDDCLYYEIACAYEKDINFVESNEFFFKALEERVEYLKLKDEKTLQEQKFLMQIQTQASQLREIKSEILELKMQVQLLQNNLVSAQSNLDFSKDLPQSDDLNSPVSNKNGTETASDFGSHSVHVGVHFAKRQKLTHSFPISQNTADLQPIPATPDLPMPSSTSMTLGSKNQ